MIVPRGTTNTALWSMALSHRICRSCFAELARVVTEGRAWRPVGERRDGQYAGAFRGTPAAAAR